MIASKLATLIPFAAIVPFNLVEGQSAAALPDVTTIVKKMQAASERQRSHLCSYSVTRLYTLQNKHIKPDATMQVKLTYQRGESKHFQVLSMRAHGVARRSLEDLLKNELKIAEGQQDNNAVNTSNYRFALIGEENCGSRRCYKLALTPRHKTKYMVEGTAWVNRDDYAVVRIAGHLAKSPSFWIKAPKVEQRFENVDGFWMPSYNHSSTRVLFFGEADLTIDYSDYRVQLCSPPGTERQEP